MMSLLTTFSYPLLVLSSIVAQPAAALASGALAQAGIVHFGLVFGLIFVTDMVADTVWYVLGYRYGEPAAHFVKKFIRVNDATVVSVQSMFRTRPAQIIISAKLSGGFGMMPFILFTAGTSKIPFMKYIALNALGEFGWTGCLMLVGYFFSSAIYHVEDVISKVFLLVGALLVLIVGGYVLGLHTRSYFERKP